MMRDFLIPTFEEFQRLRTLRKAERRKRSQEHSETGNDSHEVQEQTIRAHCGGQGLCNDHSSTWRLVVDGSPSATFTDNCVNDEGSAKEFKDARESPPADENINLEMRDIPLNFDASWQHPHPFESNLPDVLSPSLAEEGSNHGRRKRSRTTTSVDNDGKHKNKLSTKTADAESPSGPPVSPLQESPSPDNRLVPKQLAGRKPWFRRRRKPKLQQMRLSFLEENREDHF